MAIPRILKRSTNINANRYFLDCHVTYFNELARGIEEIIQIVSHLEALILAIPVPIF